MDARSAPRQTAKSVLAVLAGVPLHQAAARIAVEPADLADAVAVYQAAGYAALEAHAATCGWYQVRIQFTDWNSAEHAAATHLSPPLQQAQDTGLLAAWWFLRKAPCWRLRCRPGPAATVADLQAAISTVLDSLTEASLIDRWWETVYEPEVCAFGGPHGMDIAHDLFHADSRGILDYLRRHDPHRAAGGHHRPPGVVGPAVQRPVAQRRTGVARTRLRLAPRGAAATPFRRYASRPVAEHGRRTPTVDDR